MRSPTAADIAPALLGVEADCAGLSEDACVILDAEQIAWAEVIAVTERRHLSRLKGRFTQALRGKRLVCLDIPDSYTFGQPELIALLRKRLPPHRTASDAYGCGTCTASPVEAS
jgi:predicted protein tyrosine phosphatase